MDAALSVHDASVRYGRGPTVFEGFSEEFCPGEIVALTGRSGVGKSTLLYALSLLIRLQSGQVRYGGRSVSDLDDVAQSRFRSTAMGYVFQDAALDPGRSIVDNVCEPAVYAGRRGHQVRDRARALLARFGVSEPPGRKPGQVSGGQAQRVALCRALLLRPAVIFGDEPTGNLDTQTADVVWAALAQHAGDGGIVIVATHDEALARRADRQVVLPR